jgi:hypothetical protein
MIFKVYKALVGQNQYLTIDKSINQPKDLQASREIKVMFTGDLERTIFTNPFFFGKEKHYLRA